VICFSVEGSQDELEEGGGGGCWGGGGGGGGLKPKHDPFLSTASMPTGREKLENQSSRREDLEKGGKKIVGRPSPREMREGEGVVKNQVQTEECQDSLQRRKRARS